MSRIAPGSGLHVAASATVPLIVSGVPGSSAPHNCERNGAPFRYAGPRMLVTDPGQTSLAKTRPKGSAQSATEPASRRRRAYDGEFDMAYLLFRLYPRGSRMT